MLQVWFEDVGLYFGGEVVSYHETNDIHTVTWDTADHQTTRVELREKDHTTDKENDSRWCLESELAEFENNAVSANNTGETEINIDIMETNNDNNSNEVNKENNSTHVEVIELEDESSKQMETNERIIIRDTSSVNLNSDMSIGEAMALVDDMQSNTGVNNEIHDNNSNNNTDEFVQSILN